MISFPENQPAAAEILAHDNPAVIQAVPDPAAPERFVEPIVGVLRNNPHADQRLGIVEPCPQIGSLLIDDVAQLPVRRFFDFDDFAAVNPRMAFLQAALRFFRHGHRRKLTLLFHVSSLIFTVLSYLKVCEITNILFPNFRLNL